MRLSQLAALATFALCLVACDNLTAEDHLNRAETYLSDGELNAAVIELKNALQKDPKLGPARLELGRQYLSMGDAPSAVKELERALDLGEPRQVVLPLLLQAKLDIGGYSEVLGALEVETRPLSAELTGIEGYAYLQAGDVETARPLLAKALNNASPPALAYLGSAGLALIDNDRTGAIGYLDEGVVAVPDSRRLWLAKADIHAQAGEVELARAAYSEAAGLPGNDLMPELGLVRLMILERNLDGAKADLDQLHKRAPKHPIVNYFTGLVAYEQGDLDAAEAAIRQVQAVLPDHLPSLLIMGTIKFRQASYAQAESQLGRYVTRNPDDVTARKVLAATRLANDDPESAVGALVPVADSINDAEGLMLLGNAYLESGDHDNATRYLQRAALLDPEKAQIRMRLALSLLASGENAAAESELQTAVDLDQGVAQSEILLILLKVREGDLEAAENAASAFIDRAPDNPIAYNLKGAVELARGNVETAKGAFRQALDKDPSYSPAASNLAKLAIAEGDVNAARKEFEQVLVVDSTNLPSLMGIAQLDLSQGNTEAAIESLEKARTYHADSTEPRIALARLALLQQRFDEAAEFAEEAVRIAPDNPDAQLVAAQAALATQDATTAKRRVNKLYEDVIDGAPNPNLLIALGDLNMRLRDFDRAANSFRTAAAANSSAPALVGLMNAEMALGNAAAAREAFQRLAAADVPPAQMSVLEGDLLLMEGEPEQAEERYRAAAATGDRNAVSKLGLLLAQTADISEARAIYKDWLNANPDDTGMRMLLAQLELSTGDTDNATKSFEELSRNSPDNPVVLNNLAWLYAEQGKVEEALELARKAEELAPDNPDIADTLGWILVSSKTDLEEGLKHLERASRSRPDNPSIQYHLAVAYQRTGQTQASITALQRSLEKELFPERAEAEALLAEVEISPDA